MFFATSLLLLTGLAAPLAAQEPQPPPPDTVIARDTLGFPLPDTLPPRAGADTLPEQEALVAPPTLPELPGDSARAALPGVFVWDRAALLRSGAVTLTDLLETAPGVHAFRTGYYGAPEALSGWAAGANAIEVVLDGFPLDPLEGQTIDVAHLPLVNLRRVRLERRAGLTRIELETIRPAEPEPFSIIEAQTGEPLGLNAFRGAFLAPRFLFGPFGLAFERVGGDGLSGEEPANLVNAWLQWSLISDAGDQGSGATPPPT